MDKTPNFLMEEKESIDVDALSRLKEMVDAYKEQRTMIAEAEEKLKMMKESFNKLSQEQIPRHLLKYGISDIKLDTGEKVKIKTDINVTIEDEQDFFFYKFLRERNEDDIVKSVFKFDRMSSEKLQALEEFIEKGNYSYEYEKAVHWQTRKKYFKELTGYGLDPVDYQQKLEQGLIVKREDLPSFVSIYDLAKTEVK